MARRGGEEACVVVVRHLSSTYKQQVEDYVQQQQQQQQRVLPWDRCIDHQDLDPDKKRRGPLCSTAVRALHPVSRSCCRAAREGLTYVRLNDCQWTPASDTDTDADTDAGTDAGTDADADAGADADTGTESAPAWLPDTPGGQLPWGLLAAASEVTAISLDVWQVSALLAGPWETVAALTGRLTALEVAGVGQFESVTSEGGSTREDICRSSTGKEQAAVLGRLLVACTGLQTVRISGRLWKSSEQVLQAALGLASAGSRALQSGAGSRAQPTRRSPRFSQQSLPAARPGAAAGGSSSSSGGGRRRLPFLHLDLQGLPFAPFRAWLQQRGQLGQLRSLILWTRGEFGCCWTEVPDLQELQLEGDERVGPSAAGPPGPWGPLIPAGLAALSSSLTRLSLRLCLLGAGTLGELAALTRLRRLELLGVEWSPEGERLALGWLTGLQQLTYLGFSCIGVDLPPDLGSAAPGLQELVLEECHLTTFPADLTALTQLKAYDCEDLPWAVEAGMATATSLRHLDLTFARLNHLDWLAQLSQLEVLVLSGTRQRVSDCCTVVSETEAEEEYGTGSEERSSEHGTGSQGADSQHGTGSEGGSSEHGTSSGREGSEDLLQLGNLRRLDLYNTPWQVADLVTLCDGAQRLTSLDLSGALQRDERWSDAGNLPALGVLPALQELTMTSMKIDPRHWPAVGSWLGLQSQLVRLHMRAIKLQDRWMAQHLQLQAPLEDLEQLRAQGLARLPTQLEELDLSHCGLKEPPQCLSRLTALKVLRAGGWHQPQLQRPTWLSALQQLEVLEL